MEEEEKLYMSFSVLIVDDEKMPREILHRYIPWQSYGVTEIYEAEDGEGALALVREKSPDIIISDMKMPRMNGLALAQEVRSILPDCQFVFLSGYSDKEYLKGAIRLKAASYVEKPINLEEINEVLTEIAEHLRKMQQQDPRLLFFRGVQVKDAVLNNRVYSPDEVLLTRLGESIRHKNRKETEGLLEQLYQELHRCEGTPPEDIRRLFCRIILLFINASESRNLTAAAALGNELILRTAGGETLAGLHEMLHSLQEVYFDTQEPEEQDLSTRVNLYLAGHWSDPGLTVQDMAQELGFTNTYLCAAYKKSSGLTINQYITRLRVEHARELLSSTQKKLYEVGKAVGYTDGKYFTKVFTRETGLTPKQYRERHWHEE